MLRWSLLDGLAFSWVSYLYLSFLRLNFDLFDLKLWQLWRSGSSFDSIFSLVDSIFPCYGLAGSLPNLLFLRMRLSYKMLSTLFLSLSKRLWLIEFGGDFVLKLILVSPSSSFLTVLILNHSCLREYRLDEVIRALKLFNRSRQDSWMVVQLFKGDRHYRRSIRIKGLR